MRFHSSSISKAGNTHLSRVVVKAAWFYRHRLAVDKALTVGQRRSSPPGNRAGVEGSAASASTLCAAARARQVQRAGGRGGCAGAARA